MSRPTRIWNRERDDDPLAGLVNLFDVWIVIVVGLVFALLKSTSGNLAEDFNASQGASVESKELVEIPHYRESNSMLGGRGTKLGIAYRLENGEVVYAPDESPAEKSPAEKSPAEKSPAAAKRD